jgi:hypothetical protein
MRTILLTGFEPFGATPVGPADRVAWALDRAGFGGLDPAATAAGTGGAGAGAGVGDAEHVGRDGDGRGPRGAGDGGAGAVVRWREDTGETIAGWLQV